MIEWKELFRWQKDWFKYSKEAVLKREVFIKRMLSNQRAHFSRAVETIRHGRARFVGTFADVYADRLELDSSVATTTNPDRLIELAVRLGHNKKPDPQRWFEAISRFDQAIAVGKIEMADRHESVDRDMNDLIDYLDQHVFCPGFIKREIFCYHDPNVQYIVRADDVGIERTLKRPDLVQRKSLLMCRQLRNGVHVFMRHRIKDPFDTWLKIERQRRDSRIENPTMVNDRCGLTFILSDESVLQNVAIELLEVLLDGGAEEVEPLESNHHSDLAMDTQNQHSSSGYRAAKMLVRLNGRLFEFQFITYHDYYTSKRSLTDSNHDLYKLKQAINNSLPLLWPERVYSIAWSNPQTRHTLRLWKEAQLGWRVHREAHS